METFGFWMGIDWGSETHQVCAVDAQGNVLWEEKVEHTGEAIGAFCDRLSQRVGGQLATVAVGIEAPHGAIIEALIELGIAVYSLNPKQLDRFRDRHTVAGAKDDRRDAFVLADALRTDLKLFRRIELGDPLVVELRAMVRAHEELTADAVSLGNRLREQLRRYYPQVLGLGDLHEEPWMWELLELAPTPARAKHLPRAKVQALLDKHHIRRHSADQVLAALRTKPLPVAPGVVEAASGHVALLLPRLRVTHQQRRACMRKLEALMAQLSAPSEDAADGATDETPDPPGPRDAAILLSLPGLGVVTGATMLAEATNPLRHRDYQSLRAQSGVAPVSFQTGKQRRPTVAMRHACNSRLRNATYHWARVSMQHDEHSREHYARLRRAGHSHGRALRGVADRLLAVLVAMLKSRSLYCPALRHRPSPSAPTDSPLPLAS
jgi:transposase